MIKHNYKGWEIAKVGRGAYYATRLSDYHLAPQTFRRLKDAKAAIDNGEAALTANEWSAKKILQDLKAFPEIKKAVERSAYLGHKDAEIALKWYDEESKDAK